VTSIGSGATGEARSLGHGACGEEHLLLAWLASDLPAEERRELERRGLTLEVGRSSLGAVGPDPTATPT